jgi:hypothetical protein
MTRWGEVFAVGGCVGAGAAINCAESFGAGVGGGGDDLWSVVDHRFGDGVVGGGGGGVSGWWGLSFLEVGYAIDRGINAGSFGFAGVGEGDFGGEAVGEFGV